GAVKKFLKHHALMGKKSLVSQGGLPAGLEPTVDNRLINMLRRVSLLSVIEPILGGVLVLDSLGAADNRLQGFVCTGLIHCAVVYEHKLSGTIADTNLLGGIGTGILKLLATLGNFLHEAIEQDRIIPLHRGDELLHIRVGRTAVATTGLTHIE